MFSLYNGETISALKRISSMWGIPVSLETMNIDGNPIIITASKESVDVAEKGEGPKFDD